MTEEHEDVEASLSVAARSLGEDALHVAPLSVEKPGLHLQLVDFSNPQSAEDDEDWDLDPSSDLGLKITLAGLDPEVAVQLLTVAAEFLSQAEFEEG
ncbi:MAG TPA: hypothetical protein VIR30_05660 [Nocardioides sp.]|uniref:Uncharacterized protein n=1 Tax=Nocardioides daedukensis TaxID=634462 RepID=A0A7Y9S0L3_9ACTN|nr:hypothetical protein [Nocardioides daedukensis]NYG58951.1 hypothetical protein [Nocardioides daedukensis]